MKNKKGTLLLFLIYLAFVLWLTVFRDGFSTEEMFKHGSFNLEPFADLIKVYHNDRSVFYYLFFGNIVTFIPFGFFVLPLVNKSKRKRKHDFGLTVLLGLLFSLSIELSQWAFGVGVSETDDLVLNTLGVLLGATAALPLLRKR